MKLKYYTYIIIFLLLIFSGIGITRRQSYTNITANSDFVEDFYVAEMPSELAVYDCQNLKAVLSNTPIILKVYVVETPHCFFNGRMQKVRICEVFAGENLEVGQEIYLMADGWTMDLDEKTIETGFINILKVGTEYLVFVSEFAGIFEDEVSIYRVQSGEFISAIFCYETSENGLVQLIKEGISLHEYSAVRAGYAPESSDQYSPSTLAPADVVTLIQSSVQVSSPPMVIWCLRNRLY